MRQLPRAIKSPPFAFYPLRSFASTVPHVVRTRICPLAERIPRHTEVRRYFLAAFLGTRRTSREGWSLARVSSDAPRFGSPVTLLHNPFYKFCELTSCPSSSTHHHPFSPAFSTSRLCSRHHGLHFRWYPLCYPSHLSQALCSGIRCRSEQPYVAEILRLLRCFF